MKTIGAFTMALTTLVLATAADATVQDRRCQWGRGIGIRAGTPCLISPPFPGYSTEIIERPHNGTAVLRPDGTIYYSPKPGFTGRDGLRVRPTHCHLRDLNCFLGVPYAIFVE
jgi:hypothetical protein